MAKKGISREKMNVRGLVQLVQGVLIYCYFFSAPTHFHRHFVAAILQLCFVRVAHYLASSSPVLNKSKSFSTFYGVTFWRS